MSELLKLFAFTADQAQSMAATSVTEPPLLVEGVTLIPVSKLSCGFVGGGSDLAAKKKVDGLMAGASVKVNRTPLAFLAICEGQVQLLHVEQDTAGKQGLLSSLLPLVLELKEKLTAKKEEASAASE